MTKGETLTEIIFAEAADIECPSPNCRDRRFYYLKSALSFQCLIGARDLREQGDVLDIAGRSANTIGRDLSGAGRNLEARFGVPISETALPAHGSFAEINPEWLAGFAGAQRQGHNSTLPSLQFAPFFERFALMPV